MKKSDVKKKIADLAKVIRLDPSHVMAFQERGLANLGNKDYDRAIADFTVIIQLEPHDARYCYRAEAYLGNGENDKAIADCTTAIQINPKSIGGYETRAKA